MSNKKKTFLGMPMNWEWNTKKALHAMWNADDDRLLPPKTFGIGWTVNLHAVIRKLGLIPKDSRKRSPLTKEKTDR